MAEEEYLVREKMKKEKLMKSVFGKKKVEEQKKKEDLEKGQKKKDKKQQQIEYAKSLCKPKDKWKRGKVLMQLKKEFPHDAVIERMVREEFRETKVFKYAPEYDAYDDKEDRVRKTFAGGEKKIKDDEKGQALLDAFKEEDRDRLAYERRQRREQREKEKEFHEFIEAKVIEYSQMRRLRKELMRKEIIGVAVSDEERKQLQTWRSFLAAVFREMEKKFKVLTNQFFPHLTYGTKKSSETAKKAFPNSFKVHFFQLEKAYHKKGG